MRTLLKATLVALVIAFVAGAWAVRSAQSAAAAVPTATYRLFPTTTTPSANVSPISTPIEVGVRFSPKVKGHATGMRFWKGSGNTGTHVGTLWSAQRHVLARTTFVGESASGWQHATFSNPVVLGAGQTYVLSYHAPRGHISSTASFFTRSVQTTVLTAPASSSLARNGVFASGASSVFPNLGSWTASNFWVDIDFVTAPPTRVCGNPFVLNGPASRPAGAVMVPAGNNSGLQITANKTYYFAPGVHTLGTSQYSQIIPKNGTTFIGAPGAIIDGQNKNAFAFTQHATNVKIAYLTIRNFVAPLDQGVVNHDSGNNWTIQNNTITKNAGAALMAGANNVIKYNCLADNGQYGINAYQAGDGITNLVVDHNEITGNNTGNWEAVRPGCGCTGGAKFWAVNGATITNNYVHDNRSVGLWADTNNRAFNIGWNYISDNFSHGIFYEISYNAFIHDNTLIRNAIKQGPTNPGFPTGAIYLSESGGDSRAGGKYPTLVISGNVFTDNWSGVILWENADRFCGSPANTSSGYCTPVNPTVVKTSTCNATNITKAPYYADCRWKTKNVSVHDNTFNLTPSNVPGCSPSTGCGYNGVFSNWGTYPSWSPYKTTTVQNAITHNQNNTFAHNTYKGPWRFMPLHQAKSLTFSQWKAAPYRQDTTSTITP